MASLIPVAMNDARNAALLHTTGADKKAFNKMGNKWAKIAKNPAKSAWKSFTSIFGFGMPHTMRRPIRHVPKSKPCGSRGKGAGARHGRPVNTRKRK